MKIINFITGKDLGGPKQSFVLYSEAISSLGYEIHSIMRKGAAVKPMIEDIGLPVYEINYSRITQLFAKKKVVNKLRPQIVNINPNIIFAHKQSDLELVQNATDENVKIIGVIHWFSNKNIQYADELIAVSAKVKEFLINSGYTKPIHIVPNMVKIISKPIYRDLPSVPIIGAMGLFRRKKGFHSLIKALAILKQNGTSFKAVIAGKGQLKPYLYYLRWKLKLTNELTIKSWVSNKERERFIDNIDIFVLPSRVETFGMVVIEAMARMKCVIATKCGGPEEIIADGIDGHLVEKQNPEALAEKITHTINNPKNYKKTVIAANDKIKTVYTIEKITKKLAKILK